MSSKEKIVLDWVRGFGANQSGHFLSEEACEDFAKQLEAVLKDTYVRLMPVTAWFRINDGKRDYNHFEDGWVTQDNPTPKGDTKFPGKWEFEHKYMTDEQSPTLLSLDTVDLETVRDNLIKVSDIADLLMLEDEKYKKYKKQFHYAMMDYAKRMKAIERNTTVDWESESGAKLELSTLINVFKDFGIMHIARNDDELDNMQNTFRAYFQLTKAV